MKVQLDADMLLLFPLHMAQYVVQACTSLHAARSADPDDGEEVMSGLRPEHCAVLAAYAVATCTDGAGRANSGAARELAVQLDASARQLAAQPDTAAPSPDADARDAANGDSTQQPAAAAKARARQLRLQQPQRLVSQVIMQDQQQHPMDSQALQDLLPPASQAGELEGNASGDTCDSMSDGGSGSSGNAQGPARDEGQQRMRAVRFADTSEAAHRAVGQAVAAAVAAGWSWEGVLAALQAEAVEQEMPGAPALAGNKRSKRTCAADC